MPHDTGVLRDVVVNLERQRDSATTDYKRNDYQRQITEMNQKIANLESSGAGVNYSNTPTVPYDFVGPVQQGTVREPAPTTVTKTYPKPQPQASPKTLKITSQPTGFSAGPMQPTSAPSFKWDAPVGAPTPTTTVPYDFVGPLQPGTVRQSSPSPLPPMTTFSPTSFVEQSFLRAGRPEMAGALYQQRTGETLSDRPLAPLGFTAGPMAPAHTYEQTGSYTPSTKPPFSMPPTPKIEKPKPLILTTFPGMTSMDKQILEKAREAPKVYSQQGAIDWARQQLGVSVSQTYMQPSIKPKPRIPTSIPGEMTPMDKQILEKAKEAPKVYNQQGAIDWAKEQIDVGGKSVAFWEREYGGRGDYIPEQLRTTISPTLSKQPVKIIKQDINPFTGAGSALMNFASNIRAPTAGGAPTTPAIDINKAIPTRDGTPNTPNKALNNLTYMQKKITELRDLAILKGDKKAEDALSNMLVMIEKPRSHLETMVQLQSTLPINVEQDNLPTTELQRKKNMILSEYGDMSRSDIAGEYDTTVDTVAEGQKAILDYIAIHGANADVELLDGTTMSAQEYYNSLFAYVGDAQAESDKWGNKVILYGDEYKAPGTGVGGSSIYLGSYDQLGLNGIYYGVSVELGKGNITENEAQQILNEFTQEKLRSMPENEAKRWYQSWGAWKGDGDKTIGWSDIKGDEPAAYLKRNKQGDMYVDYDYNKWYDNYTKDVHPLNKGFHDLAGIVMGGAFSEDFWAPVLFEQDLEKARQSCTRWVYGTAVGGQKGDWVGGIGGGMLSAGLTQNVIVPLATMGTFSVVSKGAAKLGGVALKVAGQAGTGFLKGAILKGAGKVLTSKALPYVIGTTFMSHMASDVAVTAALEQHADRIIKSPPGTIFTVGDKKMTREQLMQNMPETTMIGAITGGKIEGPGMWSPTTGFSKLGGGPAEMYPGLTQKKALKLAMQLPSLYYGARLPQSLGRMRTGWKAWRQGGVGGKSWQQFRAMPEGHPLQQSKANWEQTKLKWGSRYSDFKGEMGEVKSAVKKIPGVKRGYKELLQYQKRYADMKLYRGEKGWIEGYSAGRGYKPIPSSGLPSGPQEIDVIRYGPRVRRGEMTSLEQIRGRGPRYDPNIMGYESMRTPTSYEIFMADKYGYGAIRSFSGAQQRALWKRYLEGDLGVEIRKVSIRPPPKQLPRDASITWKDASGKELLTWETKSPTSSFRQSSKMYSGVESGVVRASPRQTFEYQPYEVSGWSKGYKPSRWGSPVERVYQQGSYTFRPEVQPHKLRPGEIYSQAQGKVWVSAENYPGMYRGYRRYDPSTGKWMEYWKGRPYDQMGAEISGKTGLFGDKFVRGGGSSPYESGRLSTIGAKGHPDVIKVYDKSTGVTTYHDIRSGTSITDTGIRIKHSPGYWKVKPPSTTTTPSTPSTAPKASGETYSTLKTKSLNRISYLSSNQAKGELNYIIKAKSTRTYSPIQKQTKLTYSEYEGALNQRLIELNRIQYSRPSYKSPSYPAKAPAGYSGASTGPPRLFKKLGGGRGGFAGRYGQPSLEQLEAMEQGLSSGLVHGHWQEVAPRMSSRYSRMSSTSRNMHPGDQYTRSLADFRTGEITQGGLLMTQLGSQGRLGQLGLLGSLRTGELGRAQQQHSLVASDIAQELESRQLTATEHISQLQQQQTPRYAGLQTAQVQDLQSEQVLAQAHVSEQDQSMALLTAQEQEQQQDFVTVQDTDDFIALTPVQETVTKFVEEPYSPYSLYISQPRYPVERVPKRTPPVTPPHLGLGAGPGAGSAVGGGGRGYPWRKGGYKERTHDVPNILGVSKLMWGGKRTKLGTVGGSISKKPTFFRLKKG